MSIDLVIRRSGQSEGGDPHRIRGTGAIDTSNEARRALSRFPSSDPDQFVAVVGTTSYRFRDLVRIRDTVITVRGSVPTVGPVEVMIPGNPLGNNDMLPLRGAADATVSNSAGGQRYRIDIQSDGGLQVQTTGTPHPNRLDLTTTVGDDLAIQLQSVTTATGISLNVDPSSNLIEFSLDNFTLLSEIASGHIVMSGNRYSLAGSDTSADAPNITVSLNPTTRRLTLSLTAPPWPEMSLPPSSPHSTPPTLVNPSRTAEFLRWTPAQWEQYRRDMQSPTRRHVAVLSEENTRLPGGYFPPGNGPVYINIRPQTDGSRTQTISVTIPSGQGLQQGVIELLSQARGQLDMRRLWPNPPLPNPAPAESIVYNAGQDTLFILDPNDTELIDRVSRGLGIDSDQARLIVQNGRIDMDVLVQHTPHIPPDAVRGLARAYFDTSQPASAYMTNRGHRFFLALGDIRENITNMVGTHGEYWNSSVRTTRPRSFPVLDTEPDYRGAMPQGTDGVNMTLHSYLPYNPTQVTPLLSGMQDYRYWMPWVTHSARPDDGTFTGRIDRRHRYHVQGQTATYGSVQSFAYAPVAGDTEGNSGFETYAGRYLVVPATDPNDPTHAVNGSFVIQQVAIDFRGTDARVYRGRDENLDPIANPTNFIIGENLLARIGDISLRMANPNEDPAQVSRYRLNRSISNLYAILFGGGSASSVNPNHFAADAMSLSYVPSGIADTSRPHEYMTFLREEGDDGTVQTAIALDVRSTERDRVIQIMTEQLGVDTAWAEQRITAGRIEIADLASLTVVTNPSAQPPTTVPLSTIMSTTTLTNFSQMMLQDLASPFISRGERFLTHIGDIRRHISHWQNGSVDFRSFAPSRFHVWSDHNHDPSDSTDSVAYIIFPNDVPLSELQQTFHHPESFRSYASDFQQSATANCGTIPGSPWGSDTSCTDVRLDIQVRTVDYRIAHPTNLQTIGNVGHTPWTWATRPDITQQGMEENEGDWVLVPLEGNRGTLVLRIGLLNTIQRGDIDLARTAFSRVPSFLTGVHQATVRRHTGDTSRTGFNFRFREVFNTQ